MRRGNRNATQPRRAFLAWLASALVIGAAGESALRLDELVAHHAQGWAVVALAGVAVSAQALALAMRHRGLITPIVLLVAVCLFGAARMAVSDCRWNDRLRELGTTSNSPKRLVRVSGVVASTPRADEFAWHDSLVESGSLCEDRLARFVPRSPSVRFMLELESMAESSGAIRPSDGTLVVAIAGLQSGCLPGDRVEVVGWLSGFTPPDNPGGFDSAGWARSRRIAGSIAVASSDLVRRDASPASTTTAHLARWRAWVEGALWSALPESAPMDARALVAASTTGARWPGLRHANEPFVATGVQHLVAISGFNFALLAACAIWVLQRARAGPKVVGAILVVLAVLFAASIESEVSSVRAAIMGGSAAMALMAGRRVKLGSILAIAAIAIVLVDPLAASSPGLQLSFGAVLGLHYLTRPMEHAIEKIVSGPNLRSVIVRRASAPVVASLAAWLATAPIVIAHFGRAPLLCVPATVVLSGPFALMVVSSNVAIATRPVSSLISDCAGWSAAVNSQLVLWMVRCAAQLPGAIVPGTSVLRVGDTVPWKFRIDMLDVANGSCYLIRCGESAALFDCGSLGAPSIGSQTIVPALHALGVNKLDAVFISHPNLDHFGALPEVVARMATKRVLVTRQFLDWASHRGCAADEALRGAREFGATIETISAGDSLAFGDSIWQILHPPAQARFSDSNDSSLIIRISQGKFTMLLSGDSARAACLAMLSRSDDALRDVSVLELPHHGSFRGEAAAFASRVNSPIVLQSTGAARFLRDKWGVVLGNAHRLITTRDHACAVCWTDSGAIYLGKWGGSNYEWSDSSLRIKADEKPHAQNYRVADGPTTRLFDLQFEWSSVDWKAQINVKCVAGEWRARELFARLSHDEHAIGPCCGGGWDFGAYRETCHPLGDFVDEPLRPPDFN